MSMGGCEGPPPSLWGSGREPTSNGINWMSLHSRQPTRRAIWDAEKVLRELVCRYMTDRLGRGRQAGRDWVVGEDRRARYWSRSTPYLVHCRSIRIDGRKVGNEADEQSVKARRNRHEWI